jgi:hypothetical protein
MPVFASSKSKNHHECLEVNQAWYKCTMTRKGAWKEIRLSKVHNHESIHAYHYIVVVVVVVVYWPHLVSRFCWPLPWYQGKDIVFIFIIKYCSLRDFGS